MRDLWTWGAGRGTRGAGSRGRECTAMGGGRIEGDESRTPRPSPGVSPRALVAHNKMRIGRRGAEEAPLFADVVRHRARVRKDLECITVRQRQGESGATVDMDVDDFEWLRGVGAHPAGEL